MDLFHCHTGRAYLIMDIRAPTISKILVYHIHFALTRCIHEFCSVLGPYLSTQRDRRETDSVFIFLLCT